MRLFAIVDGLTYVTSQAKGNASPSMTSDLLERSVKEGGDQTEQEKTIKDTVSIAFAGMSSCSFGCSSS